jgi:hypothetical protein
MAALLLYQIRSYSSMGRRDFRNIKHFISQIEEIQRYCSNFIKIPRDLIYLKKQYTLKEKNQKNQILSSEFIIL